MSNVIISLKVNRVDIEVAASTPMLLILEQGFKIIKHTLTKAHTHPLPNPNPLSFTLYPLPNPNPLPPTTSPLPHKMNITKWIFMIYSYRSQMQKHGTLYKTFYISLFGYTSSPQEPALPRCWTPTDTAFFLASPLWSHLCP